MNLLFFCSDQKNVSNYLNIPNYIQKTWRYLFHRNFSPSRTSSLILIMIKCVFIGFCSTSSSFPDLSYRHAMSNVQICNIKRIKKQEEEWGTNKDKTEKLTKEPYNTCNFCLFNTQKKKFKIRLIQNKQNYEKIHNQSLFKHLIHKTWRFKKIQLK